MAPIADHGTVGHATWPAKAQPLPNTAPTGRSPRWAARATAPAGDHAMPIMHQVCQIFGAGHRCGSRPPVGLIDGGAAGPFPAPLKAPLRPVWGIFTQPVGGGYETKSPSAPITAFDWIDNSSPELAAGM